MSAADQPLALWPDEADVELPLDPEGDEFSLVALEQHNDAQEASDLAAYAYGLEQEREQLRRALVDCLALVEAGKAAPGVRVREWRALAGTTYEDNLTPEERRDDGIARAAAKWTDDEAKAVDNTIRIIAHNARVLGVGFTTADVWQALGDSFPVTKGIAGRMLAAKGAGIIANTGRTVIAPRDATGPNHGQRLTVWRAL